MKSKVLALVLSASFLLSACGGESSTKEETKPTEVVESTQTDDEKYSEDYRKDMAIVFAQNFVKDKTGIEMDVTKGNFEVSIQSFNDNSDSYIVTYSDSENERIKYIFEWNGKEEEGYYNVDPWYLLVNGEEVYNEMEEKRNQAMNGD